jgi:hypothetical protein
MVEVIEVGSNELFYRKKRERGGGRGERKKRTKRENGFFVF